MCDALVGVLKTASDRREKEEKRPPGSSSPAPSPSPRCNRRCTNSTSRFLSLPPLLPSGLQFLKAPPKKGLFPFSFVGAGGKREVRRRRRPPTWKIAQCAERAQLSYFFQPSPCHAPNSHTLIPRRETEKAVFFFSLATLPKVSLAGLLPTSRTSYVAYETIGRTFLLPAQNSTVHVSRKAKWVNSWM